jgi:hypothetical protein
MELRIMISSSVARHVSADVSESYTAHICRVEVTSASIRGIR